MNQRNLYSIFSIPPSHSSNQEWKLGQAEDLIYVFDFLVFLREQNGICKVLSTVLALRTCSENSTYYQEKSSHFSLFLFHFCFEIEEELQVLDLQSIFIKHPKVLFLNQLFPGTSASKSFQFPLQSENDLLHV